MRPAYSHPVVAFLIDLVLLGAVLTFVDSLFSFEDRIANLVSAVGALVLSITIPAIYHASFASRTLFLTPGELATGGWIVHGEKRWMNPYSISRVTLFVVFFALVFVNAPPSALGAARTLAVTFAMSACIVAVGRGYAWGLLGPMLYRTALVAQEIVAAQQAPLAEHGFDFVLLLAGLLVVFRYVAAARSLHVAEAS